MKNLILLILVVVLGFWGISYFNKKRNEDVVNGVNATTTQTTVTTTKVVPLSSSQPSLRATQDGVSVVSYTTKGFTPFITEVKLGETVRFINNRSERALQVVSVHPANSDLYYSGFSGSKPLGKGQTFELPFTKVGAWSYINLNDDNHQGVIIVTE